ncbi:filamentous hemagglutinin N-terminal domain-containing protein [Polynucleobacter sp. AP-Titi-500A-B4]|uniref:two-partner secretion domain-containing protein n=1 Tax=Polynucleobacter sp. AP-Titi-500A-B4 TaxID=2576923 RepID=UPI001BFDDD50|nr:filamentous hemagglutinin N-terminal domain-containing protein [Polynucleobacter sp. AP-Titi-500A-B4]QWE11691.1 filamentous hemagglutinin N-terminal domain-containing protein [Polynucleobacter sp. AP-Titi-500A-B4]
MQAATPAPPVNALPSNGQVVAGSAAISQTQTASSATMNVNQSSQRAVINWDSFNVGKNATVNFNQPNANSVTLNRVTGATQSLIDGAVRANGQIIFVNPNGVTFGKGAEVNAAAVVATTLNMANQEFMDGKSNFKDDGTGVGNKAGKIMNRGTIQTNQIDPNSAEGGFIALLAPEVRNQGYLLAQKGGAVALGSGSQITLKIQGQSLLAINVDQGVYNGLIVNKHVVEAPGGLVVMAAGVANQLMSSVIKNTGRISANAAISNGGVIELVAKNITQAGQVTADSQTSQGGQINLVGNEITVATNSKTTATGAIGGGQVNIGLASTKVSGGSQVNIPMQTAIKLNADRASSNNQLAQTVNIQENALIDTSATQAGNGGAIAIWSQVQTTVAGILKSMGGVLSGNGGFIETSSKGSVSLASTANINTSANNQTGKAGTWLLDPINLTIDSTAAEIISSVLSSSNVTIAVTNATSSCPGVGACTQNTLTSMSNLTIAADIKKTGSLYTKLTLSSSGDFNLNASITGQNLDVIINSSIAYLNVGTISASKVTIQAQTEIRNASVIEVSNYLLGGPAGSLGNAVELLAQAIYVTGRIVLSGSLPADPTNRLVGANINSIVDTNLDKIYSDRLIVIPATQAVGNEIYLTASQSISLGAVSQVVADGNNGGAIYLAAPTINNSLGSLIRANGGTGAGGIIGLKGNQITANGNIYANGSTVGGAITLISNSGSLDLQNSMIQAIGSTNGTINAQVTAVSSLLVTSGTPSAITGPALYSSNVLFLRENLLSATVGSVNLGYEILNSALTVVPLGSGIYANLGIAGTPTYVNGAGTISSAVSAGPYANLIVQGLSLTGADSGKYLLVLVPVTLTVAAAPSPITAVQTATSVMAPPPPPPPPVVVFAPPLPAPTPAKLEIASVLAPMVAPAPPVAANSPPPVAGGEAPIPISARPQPLVALADGTIQLTPTAPSANPPGSPPPVAAANPPANQSAPPAAAAPPPASRASANREAANNSNSDPRRVGTTRDGVDKAEVKDRSVRPNNAPSKYVSKYANGFRNGDKPAPKEGSTKTAAADKPASPSRQGKYDNRINAMNNSSAALMAMRQNPFAGTISAFPPGVPQAETAPIVLRGGDSLAQSYDDVPSIRNSGVANVGKSRTSENFHESLESVNLMSTLNLFIIR